MRSIGGTILGVGLGLKYGSRVRGGSAPPPPGPVSGYYLWLSDTGSDPGVWPDLSGNGNDAVQATVAAQPAITPSGLNGRQVRTFDGVDDFMQGAFSLIGSGCTVFSVYKLSSSSADFARVVSMALNGSSNDYDNPESWASIVRLASSESVETVFNNTAYGVIQIIYDLPVINSSLLSNAPFTVINGVMSSVGSGASPSLNSSIFSIGAAVVNSVAILSGYIAEVIIYPSALSDTDRKSVQAYLGTKWGITLGQPQITTIDFTGLTGLDFVTGINGKYCQISGGKPSIQYSPWVNTGTESDPGNINEAEVDVLPSDSSGDLASKFGTAMNTFGVWNVVVSGNLVTLTDKTNSGQSSPNQQTFPVAPVVTQTGTANS